MFNKDESSSCTQKSNQVVFISEGQIRFDEMVVLSLCSLCYVRFLLCFAVVVFTIVLSLADCYVSTSLQRVLKLSVSQL